MRLYNNVTPVKFLFINNIFFFNNLCTNVLQFTNLFNYFSLLINLYNLNTLWLFRKTCKITKNHLPQTNH